MSRQDKDIGKELCEPSVKRWEAGMSGTGKMKVNAKELDIY